MTHIYLHTQDFSSHRKNGDREQAGAVSSIEETRLFRSFQRRSARNETGPRPENTRLVSCEPLDFRMANPVHGEAKRRLHAVHAHFASQIAVLLEDQLQLWSRSEVIRLRQMTVAQCETALDGTVVAALRLSPGSQPVIVTLERPLLFAWLVRLMGGGPGRDSTDRSLTAIEQALTAEAMSPVWEALTQAWKTEQSVSLTPLAMDVPLREALQPFGSDSVVCMRLALRLGDAAGIMTVCYPAAMLAFLNAPLVSPPVPAAIAESPHAAYLAQHLQSSRVPCIAELGAITLTIGELAALKSGQIVPMQMLDESPEAELVDRVGIVDLQLGAERQFRGRMGLRGRQVVVQIDRSLPQTKEKNHREGYQRSMDYDLEPDLPRRENGALPPTHDTMMTGHFDLSRISNVPLEITVELGRTQLLIKDILALSVGSVVELDKMAGEPIDLRSSGVLIARGEVVVVEDALGVRITEIVTAAEHP